MLNTGVAFQLRHAPSYKIFIMSLVPDAIFTPEELKAIQTQVYEMKRDKIFALEDLLWALETDDLTKPNGVIHGYGGGPFGYIRYAPLKGVEIIELSQREGISARGSSEYNYNDELAWEVDVDEEYALYERSCDIANTEPISKDEFVSITSLFWQADAVTRLEDSIAELNEALKTAAGIALTLVTATSLVFQYYPVVSGAFSSQNYNVPMNFIVNADGTLTVVGELVGAYEVAVACLHCYLLPK